LIVNQSVCFQYQALRHLMARSRALVVNERTKALLRDDEGASMVEYGLMVALIAVVCLVAVTNIGVNMNAVFSDIATDL
jgi:pilus assembly protein Flp/PilA